MADRIDPWGSWVARRLERRGGDGMGCLRRVVAGATRWRVDQGVWLGGGGRWATSACAAGRCGGGGRWRLELRGGRGWVGGRRCSELGEKREEEQYHTVEATTIAADLTRRPPRRRVATSQRPSAARHRNRRSPLHGRGV